MRPTPTGWRSAPLVPDKVTFGVKSVQSGEKECLTFLQG
nr:MAG TPA: hypothetical protein [Caudoviricetes sp.]